MEPAGWNDLPAELQACILRMMYKTAWTDRVAPYLDRGPFHGLVGWRKEIEFRVGTRVKVVDDDSPFDGKVGTVVAWKMDANEQLVLEVGFAPEERPSCLRRLDTFRFSKTRVRRLGEPLRDERASVVGNIAVLRRVSRVFARELRPLYLVSFLRRDVPIGSAVAQFVRGAVQISALLGQAADAGWRRLVYLEVHSVLHSTVEYMCTTRAHINRGVPDYAYCTLQIEAAAALKSEPLASAPSQTRVGVVRRLIRWFAYLDRFHCLRRGVPCITDALADGPRRPIYGEQRLEDMHPEERPLARAIDAYPVPPGLLRPLSEEEARLLPRNRVCV